MNLADSYYEIWPMQLLGITCISWLTLSSKMSIMTLRFNVKIYLLKGKGLGRLQVTHMKITDLYSSTRVSFYCVINAIIERYKVVRSGQSRERLSILF